MNIKNLLAIVVIQMFLVSASFGQADFQEETQVGLSHTLGLGGVKEELELTPLERISLINVWTVTRNSLSGSFKNYQLHLSLIHI